MARRSSARLRSRQSPAPQRVSLSHDASAVTTRTPRTAPSKLTSVREADEVPGAFPQSPTPQAPATPRHATPVQPPGEQMHPQQHHPSTMPPAAEARHLGFFHMPGPSGSVKRDATNASLDATPSKIAMQQSSSQPVFTFAREHSLQLSPAAKQLMEEKREEAARIRDRMAADSSARQEVSSTQTRKLATPKTKKGRFSDAHAAVFDKMASIANHASSFRAQPNTTNLTVTTPSQSRKVAGTVGALKRSPSKADLVSRTSTDFKRTRIETEAGSALSSSPAKRLKRVETDDVASSRTREDGKDQAHTPSHHNLPGRKINLPSPSIHCRIPGPSTSLAKLSTPNRGAQPAKLFAKPATKSDIFSARKASATPTGQQPSALLAQSPLKASPKKKCAEQPVASEKAKAESTPLLLRSPTKKPVVAEPLQSGIAKNLPVPMLSRSPSRIPLDRHAAKGGIVEAGDTPGKSLLGRFSLLRASPIKSILRSPQRLYSDDPEKIAAGTHLATPEKVSSDTNHSSTPDVRRAQSPSKRVDFTSSTKARETETKAKTIVPAPRNAGVSPSSQATESVHYPVLPDVAEPVSPSPQKRRQTTGPADFTFRANEHGIVFAKSPGADASSLGVARPAPTIRHVSSDATTMGQSGAGSKKRKFEFESAMAMSQVTEVNKENDGPDAVETVEDERPSKRLKAMTAETKRVVKQETKAEAVSKTASRVPTLGVKPKGSKPVVKDTKKRPSTISLARLNALSQPKRRG